MFFILNKEKISSYIILFSTVLILFGIASNIKGNNAIETSTYINSISNQIDSEFINDLLAQYSNDYNNYIANMSNLESLCDNFTIKNK